MLEQGGSFQIFLNLLDQASVTPGVLVYGLDPPHKFYNESEFFLKERPTFGRLERTRLAGWLSFFRVLSWQQSRRKVFETMSRWQPDHVHALLHGLGFKHSFDWCRYNNIPFSISVHDDIRHLAAFDLWKDKIECWAAEVWRESTTCFVISQEIGEEYSRRYGKRDWIQITDGLGRVPSGPRSRAPNRLNVYFAGGLNVHYENSFLAFQQGLKEFSKSKPDWQVRFIARGGRGLQGEDAAAPRIEARPFASQQDVLKDLDEVDLLYLPLSIDPAYSNFAKFSLSTKMITYLGSGLPIFYHGPEDAAVFKLLQKNDACISCHTNDKHDILTALYRMEKSREEIVKNALALGRRDFNINEIRNRFWSSIDFATPRDETKSL